MISGVYGLPLYKGKISNVEKFLRYIETCKTEKSDAWNAECMTSSNDGSTKIKNEDTSRMDQDIFDPSWMFHYVDKQLTDNIRITMAGNFYQCT